MGPSSRLVMALEEGAPEGSHHGRGTGPHLHFEVLERGCAVDPAAARVRGLSALLKKSSGVADYPSGSTDLPISASEAEE
jgi:hypothetical protein